MTSSCTTAGVDEVLRVLRTVPGVRSVVIGPDCAGGAGLLRLDLAGGVDEVEVAATVGRLLLERFGLGVDAGQVRLIEAVVDFAAVSTATADVLVKQLNVVSVGQKVVATVTVFRGEREYSGDATGATSSDGLLRAVGEATLHALEELTDDAVVGEFERWDVVDGTASVAVLLDVDGAEIAVSGVSPVQSDPRQAIVRAVLDAVAPHLPAYRGPGSKMPPTPEK